MHSFNNTNVNPVYINALSVVSYFSLNLKFLSVWNQKGIKRTPDLKLATVLSTNRFPVKECAKAQILLNSKAVY